MKRRIIKCDDGVRSFVALWETPQHGRTTELDLQGRNWVRCVLERGNKTSKAQTRRLRAATKREIGVHRPNRQRRDEASHHVITDPEAVAAECYEWSARRMDLMQPKWFRRHDLEVGHEAWHAHSSGVRAAVVLAIDNDGHYTVQHHADDSTHNKGVRRASLCIESAFKNPTAADIPSIVTTDRPEHTALLMRRNADGRRCRLRATEGTLRPPNIADIPAQFRALLPNFRLKVIPASEERVQQSDYTKMLGLRTALPSRWSGLSGNARWATLPKARRRATAATPRTFMRPCRPAGTNGR